MKAELAPKHTQKVGDNYVLWFEKRNSYVVLSSTAYLLLIAYFESTDRASYLKQLQEKFNITRTEGTSYYLDVSSFLDEVNTEIQALDTKALLQEIPASHISNLYDFGGSHILINYGSDRLLQLIHPYIQHTLTQVNCGLKATYDIFDANDFIYLFKNKFIVGSYKTADFNFLQGKFAMELVTSIYDTKESDWLATFHASTICNNEEAIMLIGNSGNGKSTLSAVLMAHGFDLLADDFTPMLAKNQQLYRFPAAISIKPGAFSIIEDLFDGFSSTESQMSTSKHTIVKYLPPSTPFKLSQKNFECHKIVMVKYDSDSDSILRECPSENILETFIPDSWISPNSKHSKQFLDWLKNLKYYELIYSDNSFAVKKFEELFDLH